MAPSATAALGGAPVGRPRCDRRAPRPATDTLRALLAAALALALWSTQAWDRDRLLAAAATHGPLAVSGATALTALIAEQARRPEREQLAAVNAFYNERIRFAADAETSGQVDHWASPLELLGRGAGDCEDFAIAKYFSLIAAGVPSVRLRMVYVRADVAGATIPHMVLAYYPQPSAEPLILDNLRGEVLGASARRDLQPVFSFNAEGLWQGTGSQGAGDPVARLSRWREVLAQARAQGFI